MRNFLLIALVFGGLTLSAQTDDTNQARTGKEMREKMKDWTPEQHAEIRTKKLALDLDLTEAQQTKVYALALDAAKDRAAMKGMRSEKKERTSDELFELKKQRLEKMQALKDQYKTILTPEQYAKWEKRQHRGKSRKHRKTRETKGK